MNIKEIGITKYELKCLKNIIEGKKTSQEIERTENMRQPVVSMALTKLEKKGWINHSIKKTGGKGRPINVYHLAVSPEQIIYELNNNLNHIENKIKDKIDEVKKLLEQRSKNNNTAR